MKRRRCVLTAVVLLFVLSIVLCVLSLYWIMPDHSRNGKKTLRSGYHNNIGGDAVVLETVSEKSVLTFDDGVHLTGGFPEYYRDKLPESFEQNTPLEVTFNWQCFACGADEHTETVSLTFKSAKSVYDKGLFIYPQYNAEDFRTYLHFISGKEYKCFLKDNALGVWKETVDYPTPELFIRDDTGYSRFSYGDKVSWR